jgi:hypothetical protein
MPDRVSRTQRLFFWAMVAFAGIMTAIVGVLSR